MKPFAHGGDVAGFAKRCGCAPEEVIDLSSNINFDKPDISLCSGELDLSRYPDYGTLYQRVAEHYGISALELELFNGASAAIFALLRRLRESPACTIYAPAYLEYKKAAEAFGIPCTMHNRFEGPKASVEPGSTVIFVNPSTPDGRYYDMEPYLKYWQRQNATVIIDESFLDFVPGGCSAAMYIGSYSRVYIIRSMTKFYANAGVRVGAVLSQKQNIRMLRQSEPPWKLSAFDSAYIQQALQDEGFKRRTLQSNREAKRYLHTLLSAAPCIEKIYPGDANFILTKLRGIDAPTLQRKLRPHRIMVRNCENFDFLNGFYVRFAVKEKAKLQKLGAVLGKITIKED